MYALVRNCLCAHSNVIWCLFPSLLCNLANKYQNNINILPPKAIHHSLFIHDDTYSSYRLCFVLLLFFCAVNLLHNQSSSQWCDTTWASRNVKVMCTFPCLVNNEIAILWNAPVKVILKRIYSLLQPCMHTRSVKMRCKRVSILLCD